MLPGLVAESLQCTCKLAVEYSGRSNISFGWYGSSQVQVKIFYLNSEEKIDIFFPPEFKLWLRVCYIYIGGP